MPHTVVPLELEVLAEGWPTLVWCPIEVTGIDGSVDRYQLVIALHRVASPEIDPTGLIGVVTAPSGTAHAYDALADPKAALAFGRIVAPDLELRTARHASSDLTSSAVVFDERWVLRAYRHLVDGPNPDVEVPLALRRLGVEGVPTPVAVWHRQSWDLAQVRTLYRKAPDGIELARRSVDEMLERRTQPRASPADFREPAEALGAALGRIHVGLADAFGVEEATGEQLARALVVRARRSIGPTADLARVEQSYRRLGDAVDVGASIRIHGDLHLGRVLRDRHGWVFVDFGGDPMLPVDERRDRSSPLRDVAAMLQSFHHTASRTLALHDRGVAAGEPADPELALLVEAWEERAAKAFVAGYTSVDAVHQLLPADRSSRDALLAIFELNSAIEEMSRELARREPAGATVTALRGPHHPHRW